MNVMIFDLDGTLMDLRHRNLHPETKEVLERSNQDCNATYLWTMTRISKAYNTLKRAGILVYFQTIIGQYEISSQDSGNAHS